MEIVSDSRYVGIRSEMDGIFFIPFPKPKTHLEKCQRWIRLCGRKYFGVENKTKDTYICSKHFIGNGPTSSHTDPLPATTVTEFERRILTSRRKRKPSERSSGEISKKRARKSLIFEPGECDTPSEAEGSSLKENESLDNDHNYTRMLQAPE
jgi:hypothetical protein